MRNIQNKKFVIIGGGTGLANLLRGLKNYIKHPSVIVTMTDDGRSTGRLRRDFNILPPGDIRNCIAALADEEQLLQKIFSYRFPHGRGLKGHNLGNLLLVSMEDITGSFKKALQEISHILKIKGEVLPSTYEDVILSAKLKNGRVVWGEEALAIAGHRSPIKSIQLHPESAKANPDAVRAIKNADIIIIGPGSLFSSIIPNFLLKEIKQAVVKSKAKKIFICNISTERGETENFSVDDHISALVNHSDPRILDICLVNSNPILKTDGKRLGEVKNISTDKLKIGRYDVVSDNLIDAKNPLYHDSKKLTKKIVKIIEGE